MTILASGVLLLGIVFGRFFKVWVLVPACVLTFAIVFASSAYYEHSLPSALLEFSVIAACLQIGYASGGFHALSETGGDASRYPRRIAASGGDVYSGDSAPTPLTAPRPRLRSLPSWTGWECSNLLRPHARPCLILANRRLLWVVSGVFNVSQCPNFRYRTRLQSTSRVLFAASWAKKYFDGLHTASALT